MHDKIIQFNSFIHLLLKQTYTLRFLFMISNIQTSLSAVNKARQQDAEPSFKQLVYKKETSVWHDVPPAGRWVEWAEVVLGSGVQVREQRGGNDWRQAVLSAVSL